MLYCKLHKQNHYTTFLQFSVEVCEREDLEDWAGRLATAMKAMFFSNLSPEDVNVLLRQGSVCNHVCVRLHSQTTPLFSEW